LIFDFFILEIMDLFGVDYHYRITINFQNFDELTVNTFLTELLFGQAAIMEHQIDQLSIIYKENCIRLFIVNACISMICCF